MAAESNIITRRFDPLYIIVHTCGCQVVKSILEGNHRKNQRVVAWLESLKCPECKAKERQRKGKQHEVR